VHLEGGAHVLGHARAVPVGIPHEQRHFVQRSRPARLEVGSLERHRLLAARSDLTVVLVQLVSRTQLAAAIFASEFGRLAVTLEDHRGGGVFSRVRRALVDDSLARLPLP
jgi:hypothetical protein